jgi:hypothetical protein
MGTAFADRTGDLCEGCEMWQRGYDQGLKDGGGSAGLDRRERIATAALQGLLANSLPYDPDGVETEPEPKDIASLAVDIADHLIAALDTPPEAK